MKGLLESVRFLAAPQGFEPRYADPESAVLPLNEGAAAQMRVERGGTPLSDFIEVRVDGQSVLPVRHERKGHGFILPQADYSTRVAPEVPAT